MRSPLPILRGLDVVVPVRLYRAIGRRPSPVYLDNERRPTAVATGGGGRLWDTVFEEYVAEPGSQLQQRQGSIVLMTPDGSTYPVQLSRPEPRTPANAFDHADQTLNADCGEIEKLLLDGSLAVGSIRRGKQAPFKPSDVKFGEEQPLVSASPGA